MSFGLSKEKKIKENPAKPSLPLLHILGQHLLLFPGVQLLFMRSNNKKLMGPVHLGFYHSHKGVISVAFLNYKYDNPKFYYYKVLKSTMVDFLSKLLYTHSDLIPYFQC